ncbi:SMI1/KNR4 family protein [Thiobacillus sp.]|uniref:SMI1/KNR4 family protein n=1 Tax=Thiobacillus sp. TaxID=924 RepID=UPI001AC32E33|nr:SMI1/KNR4 family protein [Thiobacillus sp.]MBN8781338.1 SMI1/KNR4 family protein [Thiobacillus sp.]
MSIEKLEKILEPPIAPVDSPVADGWSDAERKLGKLPDDYKRFIELYGTGSIDGFVWIFNPFTSNKNLNLLDQIQIKISALSDLSETFGEALPFPLFPKPNGLLPFGVTDNGDVLFWQVANNPDDWKVIINAAREPKWKKYDVDMTDLLAGLLSRQIICEVFPGDFPSNRPVFYPNVFTSAS